MWRLAHRVWRRRPVAGAAGCARRSGWVSRSPHRSGSASLSSRRSGWGFLSLSAPRAGRHHGSGRWCHAGRICRGCHRRGGGFAPRRRREPGNGGCWADPRAWRCCTGCRDSRRSRCLRCLQAWRCRTCCRGPRRPGALRRPAAWRCRAARSGQGSRRPGCRAGQQAVCLCAGQGGRCRRPDRPGDGRRAQRAARVPWAARPIQCARPAGNAPSRRPRRLWACCSGAGRRWPALRLLDLALRPAAPRPARRGGGPGAAHRPGVRRTAPGPAEAHLDVTPPGLGCPPLAQSDGGSSSAGSRRFRRRRPGRRARNPGAGCACCHRHRPGWCGRRPAAGPLAASAGPSAPNSLRCRSRTCRP